jgi:bifunctional DNase/RNase
VAVAMRSGAPIFIEDELLNVLCVKEEWENAISIPITLAGTDTLREAMQRAIKDENYELAMKLKEELDARAKGDDDRNVSPEGMNN